MSRWGYITMKLELAIEALKKHVDSNKVGITAESVLSSYLMSKDIFKSDAVKVEKEKKLPLLNRGILKNKVVKEKVGRKGRMTHDIKLKLIDFCKNKDKTYLDIQVFLSSQGVDFKIDYLREIAHKLSIKVVPVKGNKPHYTLKEIYLIVDSVDRFREKDTSCIQGKPKIRWKEFIRFVNGKLDRKFNQGTIKYVLYNASKDYPIMSVPRR